MHQAFPTEEEQEQRRGRGAKFGGGEWEVKPQEKRVRGENVGSRAQLLSAF